MRIVFNLLLPLSAATAAAQGVPERPLGGALAGAAGARAGSEYLVTMPLGDLVPRTEERGGTRETDWLPPGASFDRAPRMVMVERIAGATDDGAPLRFVQGLATCLRPCPGQGLGAVDRTPFQGRPAARITMDMPATAVFSGLPSRTYALAIAGERNLHVVIVMFRGPRSAADERFAQDVLRSVVLCTPASHAAACRSD
ncbi:MAG TPA: hypothetical protein VK614_01765 [Allosphingosinicella sp.]|nr:hypothetical protein [Allosphingosinicella sp.]